MTKKDCSTLKYRVEQLEANYNEVHESMREILENHLPHLQADIQSLSTKITAATILNIGAILLAGVFLKGV